MLTLLAPSSSVSGDDWLELDRDEREATIPYWDEELDAARQDYFVASLRLHSAALATRPDAVASTMRAWGAAATFGGRLTPAERRTLWHSFFLVVPVVTTTFASASRLLGCCGSDGLGTAIIDEAGQASADQAVPLLALVRRAVIVGDQQQLEPIVTLETEVLRPIMRSHGADERWSPDRASVQHLADASSEYGTEISAMESAQHGSDDRTRAATWVAGLCADTSAAPIRCSSCPTN